MRISDWSSDVCSSDLRWLDGSFVGPLHTNKPFLHACLSMADFAEGRLDTGLIERQGEALTAIDGPSDRVLAAAGQRFRKDWTGREDREGLFGFRLNAAPKTHVDLFVDGRHVVADAASGDLRTGQRRSEEHTSELQSLMRISYAVFC